jgi:hypothetical protein
MIVVAEKENQAAMEKDLHEFDLQSLRNMFIAETHQFLDALEKESFEELKKRRERIKEIDRVMQEKSHPHEQHHK